MRLVIIIYYTVTTIVLFKIYYTAAVIAQNASSVSNTNNVSAINQFEVPSLNSFKQLCKMCSSSFTFTMPNRTVDLPNLGVACILRIWSSINVSDAKWDLYQGNNLHPSSLKQCGWGAGNKTFINVGLKVFHTKQPSFDSEGRDMRNACLGEDKWISPKHYADVDMTNCIKVLRGSSRTVISLPDVMICLCLDMKTTVGN